MLKTTSEHTKINILIIEKNKRRVELSLCVNRVSQRHAFLSLVHPRSASRVLSGLELRSRLFFTSKSLILQPAC